MATVTNFIIEETDNAKELIFKETTGAYNASLNTDGWGAPNEDVTDATAVQLDITLPGETTPIVLTDTTFVGLTSFPTTDSTLELSLNAETLGMEIDSKLPDGVWDITYTVTTTAGSYIVSHKVFVSGITRCCVYKKLASIETIDCDCDTSGKTEALEAFTFYRSLIANAGCGNEDKYDDLLVITNKLCSPNKCD